MAKASAAARLSSTLPSDPTVLLAELESLQEERRFVFHRYMEAIAIYIAIVGFAGAKYFEVDRNVRLFLLFFLLVTNTVAWLGANQFRRLAYHAITRENLLAEHLGVQKPYDLLWGYRYAMVLGAAVQIGALIELARTLDWLAV